jgi:trigger factor
MKATVEKVSSLGRKINVEVPAEIVQTTFDKVFRGIQKDAELKGFRKGKAPLATIKSIYGDRVKQDVAQELIQQHYYQVIVEHKLEPINWPHFEFDVPESNQTFTFSAAFEIRPTVDLKKYEGLEVEKELYVFDENKVTQVLENIRASRAKLVTVPEARPAKLGDIAIIDFDGTVDGKPLEGGQGKSYNLELGSKNFIDGFEEGIVGMTVGAEKTLSLKFPTPYHAKDLEGKGVEFKVKLNELKYKELPELNEELIASLGGPADLDGLKKTIREDLEASDKKRVEQDFKNRMLKALVTANPVDVPDSLLVDQKKALVDDFKKRMTEQGMAEAEFSEYVQKWDGDFATTAREIIQANFLVDEIAAKHSLKATAEDLENKLQEYAAQTGIDIIRLREFYGREEQQNRLAYQITEERVLAHLNTTAKIKELPADQLKDKGQQN